MSLKTVSKIFGNGYFWLLYLAVMMRHMNVNGYWLHTKTLIRVMLPTG